MDDDLSKLDCEFKEFRLEFQIPERFSDWEVIHQDVITQFS